MHLVREHSFGIRETSDCLTLVKFLNTLKLSFYDVLNGTHLLHRVTVKVDYKTYMNP